MKTKIFKKGDKVKYIKEPTKADWESIGEIPIPFKINDILEVYGQNMHSGSIYFKEKGFSYPNICFELYQETYKYEVVHTETQEQWDFVLSKLTPGCLLNKQSKDFTGNKSLYPEGIGVSFSDNSWGGINYFKQENSKIYLFKEWLDKFGHKSEYLKQNQKEEQWIPQVGDYIITKGYSDSYDGRILKITKIYSNRYYYFEVFDKGYYDKNHNFGKKAILRKALPHEIPTQELSKEDLLAEAKRRFPIGCKFKCLDLLKQNNQGGKIHSIDFDSFKYYGETSHYKKAITDGDNGFIYIDGIWAETVEEPKVTEKSLTESLVHSMQDDFKALQVKSMYFEKALDWSQVLRATGEFSFGTPSQKPVKNSKILPIKVRNSNITESTKLPKRTRIKIIKKQLLTI